MTDLRQAAQQALESLEYTTTLANFLLRNEKDIGPMLKANEAITSLRTALEQQQSEPVACKTLCELCVKRGYDFCANAAKTTPIIISPTPPQRKPVQKPKYMAQSNGRHSPLLTHMMNKRTALEQQQAEPVTCGYDETTGNCTRELCCRTALEQQAEALQAMNDLLTTGTSVMLDGKRVDPASIYKQAEPVAWPMEEQPDGTMTPVDPAEMALPKRKPLTDEQRNWIVATCPTPRHIIDAIEAAHGIKENT